MKFHRISFAKLLEIEKNTLKLKLKKLLYALIAEHSRASKECFLLCLWYFQKCKFIHYDYLTNTVTPYANNWSERKNMAYTNVIQVDILCCVYVVFCQCVQYTGLLRCTLCICVSLSVPIYSYTSIPCHTCMHAICAGLQSVLLLLFAYVCTLEMSNNGQNG